MTRRLSLVLFSLLMSVPMQSGAYGVAGDYEEAAIVTDYVTKVNKVKSYADCRGEGGQIVNGQYIGSNCRPFTDKFCRWGVGNTNNCLIPCVDGAGPKRWVGKVIRIRPRKCMYGPFKGQTIRYVRISDVGGAVKGRHVDVFQGLCMRTKRGVCLEYGDESRYAEYRGVDRYDETHSTVVALLHQMNLPTQYAGTPPRTQFAEVQTGTVTR